MILSSFVALKVSLVMCPFGAPNNGPQPSHCTGTQAGMGNAHGKHSDRHPGTQEVCCSASIRAGVSVRADYLNSRAQRARRSSKEIDPLHRLEPMLKFPFRPLHRLLLIVLTVRGGQGGLKCRVKLWGTLRRAGTASRRATTAELSGGAAENCKTTQKPALIPAAPKPDAII
jgi:hypothetical protein